MDRRRKTMAIIRVKKTKNFSIVSNDILNNGELSPKARFILIYCLSLADNWQFSIKGLATQMTCGIDFVRTGLKELEERGYLERKRTRNKQGCLQETDYIFYESPEPQDQEKDEPPKLDSPKLDLPILGLPILANPTLINTKYNKNQYKQELRESNSAREEWFNAFWEAYPRKTKKVTARIAFMALPEDEELYQKIIDSVEKHKSTHQWQDINYIPFAENFLQDERWEDELPSDDNDDVWGNAFSRLGDDSDVGNRETD